MKSKTGLHKKVAFIFDGTPAAQPADGTTETESAPDTAQSPPPSTYGPQPVPVAGTQRSAPVKTASKQTKNSPGLTAKKGKADAKQKKMLVLIGILSAVLVAVLLFVLNGPPQNQPKQAHAGLASTAGSQDAASTKKTGWTQPEAWPTEIRDPMTQGAQSKTETGDGPVMACVVRGIVFSKTRPSAIIGNQIAFVGDTINGQTITAIHKDTVEFEKDGERWTQPVQE